MKQELGGRRCGATIEKEWAGHRVVLTRRYCKNRPLKGYDHCRYHLTLDERKRKTAPT